MQRHVKEYAGDDGSDRTTNTTGDTVAEEYRGESSKLCNASLTKQPAHCGAVSPGEIARHVTEGATVGDLDTSNNSNSSNKSSNTKHTGMQANRCESPEEPAQELCLNTTEAETVSVLGWETESVTSILSLVADSISDWISDSELDTESTADSEVDTDIYPLTQVTPWSPASIVDESELVADSETDIEIYPLTQIVPESPASMPVELESDLDGETLVVDPPYLWALFN
ncbi:hypothetical protein EC988_003497 [Linderina pennispora]|nr:hypothetical protein EC988_003497 [Linderina pennispora]